MFFFILQVFLRNFGWDRVPAVLQLHDAFFLLALMLFELLALFLNDLFQNEDPLVGVFSLNSYLTVTKKLL